MLPKTTMSTTVAVPEKSPLVQQQKDSAVVYMVEDQVNTDNSRWQVKRAKICACTVVITTLILVAGTLGAIYIVLRLQQGTSEVATVSTGKEPLSGNNSPLEEVPIYNPPIKIDGGALWPSKIPVTPDLVAVDGLATVSLTSSPKPGTDGINVDPEETPIGPIMSSSSFQTSSDPNYEASDSYGMTHASSSIVHDSYGISSSHDIEAVDGQATSPKPATDAINADAEENPINPIISSSSYESSPDESSSESSEQMYNGRTYVSSSFPYRGYYMNGAVGERPPHRREENSPKEASGDMDSDLEGSADEEIADSSYSDPYDPFKESESSY